jgi:hypothetical protein
MDLLSSCPTELLTIIISKLGDQHDRYGDYWANRTRHEHRVPLLAMSKLNRRLWSIAKPFLYQEFELMFKPISETLYQSTHQTYLFYRSIQEDWSLASYVQSLDVRGLIRAGSSIDFSREMSSTVYTSDEVANFLALFTKVERLYFHGRLNSNIQDKSNQIILSSMRQMFQLETLLLNPTTGSTSVLHEILSATSNTLKELDLAPRREETEVFTNHAIISGDHQQITHAQFQLKKLTFPASKLPITTFLSWMAKTPSLALHDVAASHGQTNQGATITQAIAPLASCLRDLRLEWNTTFNPPSLADFDMSSMTALVCFSYSGPWWITDDMMPLELYHNLFSRKYERLSLRFGYETDVHDIYVPSIRNFRKALELACLENQAPEILNFHLDISNSEYYEYDDSQQIKKKLRRASRILRDHGVEVRWNVYIPEPPSEEDSEEDDY